MENKFGALIVSLILWANTSLASDYAQSGDITSPEGLRLAASQGDPLAIMDLVPDTLSSLSAADWAALSQLVQAGSRQATAFEVMRRWKQEFDQGQPKPSPKTEAAVRELANDDSSGLLALQLAAQAITGQWEPPFPGAMPIPNLAHKAKAGDPAAIAFACKSAALPSYLNPRLSAFCPKAVELGQPESTYAVAMMHHARPDDFRGDTEKHIAAALHIPHDLAQAISLYVKAAKAGHAGAQSRLAIVTAAGLGMAVDLPRARNLAEQSARQGWPEGQAVLGLMLLRGLGGGADPATALPLLTQAARAGNRMAQFALATLSFRGQHVPRDFTTALTWVHLAELSQRGDPPDAEADPLLPEPIRRTRLIARNIDNPALDLDARLKAAQLRQELAKSGEWPLVDGVR